MLINQRDGEWRKEVERKRQTTHCWTLDWKSDKIWISSGWSRSALRLLSAEIKNQNSYSKNLRWEKGKKETERCGGGWPAKKEDWMVKRRTEKTTTAHRSWRNVSLRPPWWDLILQTMKERKGKATELAAGDRRRKKLVLQYDAVARSDPKDQENSTSRDLLTWAARSIVFVLSKYNSI